MIDKMELHKIREAILTRIHKRQKLEARAWFAGSVFVGLASIAGIFLSVQYTIQEVYLSNFYQYLSLIFTDGGSILPYYKDFILTLAESIPLVGITAMLALVVILLSSLTIAAKKTRLDLLSI